MNYKFKVIFLSTCLLGSLKAYAGKDFQFKELEIDGPTVIYQGQVYRPTSDNFVNFVSSLAPDYRNINTYNTVRRRRNDQTSRMLSGIQHHMQFEDFNTQALELINTFTSGVSQDTVVSLTLDSISTPFCTFEDKHNEEMHKHFAQRQGQSYSIAGAALSLSNLTISDDNKQLYILPEETYRTLVDYVPDEGLSLPRDFEPMDYLRINPTLRNLFNRSEHRLFTKREILRIHYARWGEKGGLSYKGDIDIPTDFDHEVYLELHPSLKNLFPRPTNQGKSQEQILKEHYAFWGKKANYSYKKE